MRMFPGYDLLVVLLAHDDCRLINGWRRLRLLLVAAAGQALTRAPAGWLYTRVNISKLVQRQVRARGLYGATACVTCAAAVTAAAAAVAAAVRRSPACDTPDVYLPQTCESSGVDAQQDSTQPLAGGTFRNKLGEWLQTTEVDAQMYQG